MSPPGHLNSIPAASVQAQAQTGRDAAPGFFGLLFFIPASVSRTASRDLRATRTKSFSHPLCDTTEAVSSTLFFLHHSKIRSSLPSFTLSRVQCAESCERLGRLYCTQACPDPYAGTPRPERRWGRTGLVEREPSVDADPEPCRASRGRRVDRPIDGANRRNPLFGLLTVDTENAMSDRKFEYGDRVRHATRPEWGIGLVV